MMTIRRDWDCVHPTALHSSNFLNLIQMPSLLTENKYTANIYTSSVHTSRWWFVNSQNVGQHITSHDTRLSFPLSFPVILYCDNVIYGVLDNMYPNTLCLQCYHQIIYHFFSGMGRGTVLTRHGALGWPYMFLPNTVPTRFNGKITNITIQAMATCEGKSRVNTIYMYVT